MIKKTIYGIVLSCFLLTSCDLERLPLNGPTVGAGNFPASEVELDLGVNGAYKALSLLDAANTPIWHVMDNITDIGYARPGNNYTPAITSSIPTDNALATKPWSAHYKTIARCHLVLDDLDNLKGVISDEKYNKYEAELRVIRAYCYSQLVELYGDVPLVTKTLILDESYHATKTPKSEIQQWIINEMTEVADYLPVSQPTSGGNGVARVGSVAAYMLKARVALYSGQYKVAADAAKKAMDLSKGVFELTPFNSTIEYVGKTHADGEPESSHIFGHAGYRNSKEWIWIVEYNRAISGNTHNQAGYMASRLTGGVSYWGPTQNMIDSFQDKDGNPIDKSTIYDVNEPFKNRDPRLDMYCARPHSRFLGYQFEPNADFKKVNNYWPIIDEGADKPKSVNNTDATNAYRVFSGYYWRKHTDLADYGKNFTNNISDLDVGIFRYAELLLIYAEAKIELGELDASVYDAINQIRARANMPALPTGLNQAQMRTALRYERKVELCNDGLRWYDIRRWGIAEDVMNGYIYLNRSANAWTKDALISIDENYSPKYNHDVATKYFGTQAVVFKTNKDELWPVPQSERDVIIGLEQNPGY